jgi:hypothetical protein
MQRQTSHWKWICQEKRKKEYESAMVGSMLVAIYNTAQPSFQYRKELQELTDILVVSDNTHGIKKVKLSVEASRLPHFLDNRFTEGGEISLMRRLPFTSRKIPGTHFYYRLGRAIAEAVSRWLPTAAARVQSRVWSSGICGGQSWVGAGFLRVLRFPLPSFHQILHPHNHPGQVQ